MKKLAGFCLGVKAAVQKKLLGNVTNQKTSIHKIKGKR